MQYVIRVIAYLAVVAFFSACGFSQTVKNANHLSNAKPSIQETRQADFDYRKIMQASGISDIFQVEKYGVYEAVDGSVVLRIKLIGIDDEAGRRISDDHSLLNHLFNRFSLFLSKETGIDIQKIGLIAQIGACQAQVSGGNLLDIKCDKAPVSINTVRGRSALEIHINKIRYLQQKLDTCLKRIDYAACLNNDYVLTQTKLQQFCVKALAKAWEEYDFESDCQVEHSVSGSFFLIKSIRLRSYISDGYWEKFDIQLNYRDMQNKDMQFFGDLKIHQPECAAKIMIVKKRPDEKSFTRNLSSCDKNSHKKISKKEENLANLLRDYFDE